MAKLVLSKTITQRRYLYDLVAEKYGNIVVLENGYIYVNVTEGAINLYRGVLEEGIDGGAEGDITVPLTEAYVEPTGESATFDMVIEFSSVLVGTTKVYEYTIGSGGVTMPLHDILLELKSAGIYTVDKLVVVCNNLNTPTLYCATTPTSSTETIGDFKIFTYSFTDKRIFATDSISLPANDSYTIYFVNPQRATSENAVVFYGNFSSYQFKNNVTYPAFTCNIVVGNPNGNSVSITSKIAPLYSGTSKVITQNNKLLLPIDTITGDNITVVLENVQNASGDAKSGSTMYLWGVIPANTNVYLYKIAGTKFGIIEPSSNPAIYGGNNIKYVLMNPTVEIAVSNNAFGIPITTYPCITDSDYFYSTTGHEIVMEIPIRSITPRKKKTKPVEVLWEGEIDTSSTQGEIIFNEDISPSDLLLVLVRVVDGQSHNVAVYAIYPFENNKILNAVLYQASTTSTISAVVQNAFVHDIIRLQVISAGRVRFRFMRVSQ